MISIGNETQRRAIDALHQAYKQWAVQDLRLKHGTVSSQTRIEDYQLHHNPLPTIEFRDMELGSTILCTLEAPSTLLPMLRKKSFGIGGELRTNPVFRVGRKTPAVEMSMLNAGAMFDVELLLVWNILTRQVTESDALSVYVLN